MMISLAKKHARITVGVVAAFACLAPSGVAAAAPTVYVHLGEGTAREKYREKPMRVTHTPGGQELDQHTCGEIIVDGTTGKIVVYSRVRGGQIRYRIKSAARFIDGRLTADRPVPMIGLMAQYGWAHRLDTVSNLDTEGFGYFEICAKHHRFLARKVRRLPRKVRWRDMRIETWGQWKKANPEYADSRQSDLDANKKRLFAILRGGPWKESNYRLLVDDACSYWSALPGHENHETCRIYG